MKSPSRDRNFTEFSRNSTTGHDTAKPGRWSRASVGLSPESAHPCGHWTRRRAGDGRVVRTGLGQHTRNRKRSGDHAVGRTPVDIDHIAGGRPEILGLERGLAGNQILIESAVVLRPEEVVGGELHVVLEFLVDRRSVDMADIAHVGVGRRHLDVQILARNRHFELEGTVFERLERRRIER